MVRKVQRRLTAVLAFLAVTVVSFAQNSSQTDSLVRLMNARSLELIQKDGEDFRKAVDATFLHNGTYLICDTALWDVSRKIIKCQGNVQLLQDETILTSEQLDYLIDEDLAQFRGQVVQLANKKNNVLRTRNLDYNTKDSLAVFRGGAAMRDEDGQVIESDNGTYDSSRKYFTFKGNVNMFTDSVFVKTTVLEYDSDASMAKFIAYVDFWKEDNMLSAGNGWYDHNREVFFFRNDVHGLSKEQESWSDSVYFYRNTNDVLMLGNAHVQDSTRNVAALADYIYYKDSLSRVTLRKRAAVALKNEQSEKVDTVYFGADTLVYQTIRRCDIPENEIKESEARFASMTEDAVSAYRKRAAQEAEEAIKQKIIQAEEEGTILPGLQSSRYAHLVDKGEEDANSAMSSPAPADNTPADSLVVAADSLVVADSLAVSVPDTTKIGFLCGVGNVRIFKSDMQVMCDSLRYSDLDSIARFYNKPLVWNEEVRQYSSDSLFVLVKGGKADRASLMSNAFIICKESDAYYDQIKGTDVVAFFGENTELSRFDALGGVTALFYLQENETIATVNRVECRMMSATMKDGTLERVYYYSQPHNDAYPVVQLPQSEHRLKGYDWQPDSRPKSKEDVTTLSVRPSERTYYQARPMAEFRQTDIYFPGYMEQVHKDIEASRERKAREEKESAAKESSKDELADPEAKDAKPAVSDSLAVVPVITDSLAVADSLAVTDSLSVAKPEDSVSDPREQRREERELARKMRIARRDAIWAEKDARDAAKAEAKAQRALEKKRKRTKLLYLRQLKQDREDAAKLQKYIEKYQKQKDKKDERDKEAD